MIDALSFVSDVANIATFVYGVNNITDLFAASRDRQGISSEYASSAAGRAAAGAPIGDGTEP
jgi:hypothetical protein